MTGSSVLADVKPSVEQASEPQSKADSRCTQKSEGWTLLIFVLIKAKTANFACAQTIGRWCTGIQCSKWHRCGEKLVSRNSTRRKGYPRVANSHQNVGSNLEKRVSSKRKMTWNHTLENDHQYFDPVDIQARRKMFLESHLQYNT